MDGSLELGKLAYVEFDVHVSQLAPLSIMPCIKFTRPCSLIEECAADLLDWDAGVTVQ